MKRRLDSILLEHNSTTHTPRTRSPKHVYPLSGRTQKRHRSVHGLIPSPSVGTPQGPTPDSVRARPVSLEPFTAERKLAGLHFDSPIFGVTEGNNNKSGQTDSVKNGRKTELSRFSQATQEDSPILGVAQESRLPTGAQDNDEHEDIEDVDDDGDDDDCYDFLKCSQSYSRLSQLGEACNTPEEQIKQVNLLAQDSQEASQLHFSFPSSQTGASQQPTPDDQASLLPSHLGTSTAPPSEAAAVNTTPELNDATTITSAAEEGGTHVNEEECSGAKLFPIFRPTHERKMLIIIRHGESEYNKAAAEGRALADPNIFDPKLTATGRRQAQALRGPLQDHLRKHGDALWLMSPLTRCIETFLDACPCLDRLSPGAHGTTSAPPLNIQVLSVISEHVASTGDIGRPASALIKDFPMLANQLKGLSDCWWVSQHDKPNCAINKVFTTRETKEQLKRRVETFASWLSKRPEKLVIAFGHSTFWKEFTKSQTRMKNCEIKTMRW